MRKRCYRCKCLEEESSFKSNERMKRNEKSFYCRKCIKKKDLPYEPVKLKVKKKISFLQEWEILKAKQNPTDNEVKRKFQLRKILNVI